MTRQFNAEICVIGAGPAGAASAIRLSQMGHSVVVVEKERFPRGHIGESMTPGLLPLLDFLGVRRRIESERFLRPERVLLHWPPYRGFKSLGPLPGFQVDRARFDAVMLDAAREAGALVLEESHLIHSERKVEGGWDCTISCGGEYHTLSGCFLIDASGRRGAMGGKKRRYGPPTLALSAYWRDCNMPGAETRVEAGANEWYWGAPLPNAQFNATVFVDPDRVRRELHHHGTLEGVYRDLLARSELLAVCLGAHADGPIRACDATSYTDDESVGVDRIKVGEALFTVDPLSSQGVQTAIGTALHAATVVHTILSHPGDLRIAVQFYRERQQDAVAFHGATAASLYSHVAREIKTPFWASRATTASTYPAAPTAPDVAFTKKGIPSQAVIRLAPATQIVNIPCIEGEYIVERRGVTIPGRVRPTVFLNEIALAPLLDSLSTAHTVEETLRVWGLRTSRNQTARVVDWLWDNGLIVVATGD